MNFKNIAIIAILAISITQTSSVNALVSEVLSDVTHGAGRVAEGVVDTAANVTDDVVYGTDGNYINEPEYVSPGYGYRRYPYKYEIID